MRFVATDSRVGQHFPTEDKETHRLMGSEVIVYTDAAFAPMRVFERRSISGACLVYQGVTLKCYSRHQHAVSLSSCEAELHAIQAGVQESIGLARTLAFVLKSLDLREGLPALEELEEGECPLPIQLRTDSLSGKQLLESYDLQRRSRHIEIRLCWLRRLLNSSILDLTFCRGDMNLSDMFTKCVGQALFQSFREALGFMVNDLRLSVLVAEKSGVLDSHESESLKDLEGKPVGRSSRLVSRVCEVFQIRESFQKGRRCVLCDDLIGSGDDVFVSAAVDGSTGLSVSGVTLTTGFSVSEVALTRFAGEMSDSDDDRRSMREAREADAQKGVSEVIKESKKKRRKRDKRRRNREIHREVSPRWMMKRSLRKFRLSRNLQVPNRRSGHRQCL